MRNKFDRIVDGVFTAAAMLCVCGAVWYGVKLVLEAIG